MGSAALLATTVSTMAVDSEDIRMTFTNEDLQRLKEWRGLVFQMDMAQIEALLARLEAAEALVPYGKSYEPVSVEDEKEYDAKVELWRKASGKGE